MGEQSSAAESTRYKNPQLRICEECARSFLSARPRATCTEECMIERRRRRTREHHRARGGDPGYRTARAARARRTYEANRDRTQAARYARTADWRSRNAEAISAAERAYRAANADKVRAKNHRRRALLLDAWVEDVDLAELFIRDGGICGICREPVDAELPWPDRRSKTLDHIVPLSRGGTHSWGNAQLAHAACNSRKSDRDVCRETHKPPGGATPTGSIPSDSESMTNE